MPTSPWPPGPGRARAAKEELFEELGYTDARCVLGLLRPGDRPAAAGRADRAGRRPTAACALGRLTFILTPTTSLAGRGPDHRPRARGGAAQGARAGLPAGAGAGRPGRCAAAAAVARLPHRHGPDQRRDPVRRRGAAVRDRAGGARRAIWRSSCRARPRATTASRSARSSRTPASTSTRSTRCCSARPGCS